MYELMRSCQLRKYSCRQKGSILDLRPLASASASDRVVGKGLCIVQPNLCSDPATDAAMVERQMLEKSQALVINWEISKPSLHVSIQRGVVKHRGPVHVGSRLHVDPRKCSMPRQHTAGLGEVMHFSSECQ